MKTLTISKKITKGEELVVIPRRTYDKYIAVYKKFGQDIKELEAHNDIATGKVSRGYKTKKQLKDALNRLKR